MYDEIFENDVMDREYFNGHLKDAIDALQQAYDKPEYDSRFEELETALDVIEYILEKEEHP